MLRDRVFWRDTLARTGRQVVQTLIPVLLVAVAHGGARSVDLVAITVTGVMAALVTLLRAFTGLRAPARSSFAVDAADRAAAAAAGTLLGLITTDGFDLLQADLAALAVSVLGSALMAVLAMFTNTPSTPPETPTPLEDILPDGPSHRL